MQLEFNAIMEPSEGTAKLRTAVYVDYESLYWSFYNQLAALPDLELLVADIKKNAAVAKITVFGDFQSEPLGSERQRIRTVTNDIIDCSSHSDRRKDFTDFIMLDHMYRDILQNSSMEQFILVTGDGHFSSFATFVRTFLDKSIGVYGVRGTLSNQLTVCASWAKVIDCVDADDSVYVRHLIHNFKLAEAKGTFLTFKKTAAYTAQYHSGETLKYERILSQLIEDGYVFKQVTNQYGKDFTAIMPNWERINAELLPQLDQVA
ncbi:MAG: NYN domain-containing protein [Oscillospiraceae bacterium]|jgi:hypothetical protein|nr:NYN domain-containing protein [Oscillospiraceae bacterium]